MPVFNPTIVVGTTDQVLANGLAGTPQAGSITLSLPQSVATTSNPTFSSLRLTGLNTNTFLYSDATGTLATTTAATNGQILIGSTGAAPVKSVITPGTGIGVTNGAGSITLANTGVTSIVAGAGINVSGATGAVTVSSQSFVPGSGYALRLTNVAIGSLSGTTQMASTTAATITNGWQIATITVTPLSTSSTFSLSCTCFTDGSSNNRNIQMAVFRGSVNVGASSVTITTSGRPQMLSVIVVDAPATASPVTYSVRVGMNATGTSYVNQYNNGDNMGGTAESSFVVIELA